jgi:hypothetical protein
MVKNTSYCVFHRSPYSDGFRVVRVRDVFISRPFRQMGKVEAHIARVDSVHEVFRAVLNMDYGDHASR